MVLDSGTSVTACPVSEKRVDDEWLQHSPPFDLHISSRWQGMGPRIAIIIAYRRLGRGSIQIDPTYKLNIEFCQYHSRYQNDLRFREMTTLADIRPAS